eukprot:4225623-Prymnesium_polylepis.1
MRPLLLSLTCGRSASLHYYPPAANKRSSDPKPKAARPNRHRGVNMGASVVQEVPSKASTEETTSGLSSYTPSI